MAVSLYMYVDTYVLSIKWKRQKKSIFLVVKWWGRSLYNKYRVFMALMTMNDFVATVAHIILFVLKTTWDFSNDQHIDTNRVLITSKYFQHFQI